MLASVLHDASNVLRPSQKRTNGAHRLRAALVRFTNHFYRSPALLETRRRSDTPPQRQTQTMQAATLVALLIPVVAIWITVVVRYGRSIEEIVVATVEKEE